MKIYGSVEELIGSTPLVELKRIEREECPETRLLAKLESANPAGSAKDRAARTMVDEAERQGILRPGTTVIEPTSGNTGIGLALIGALRGYRVIIVMPDAMSGERIKLMTAYGAEVILSDGRLGMQGAIAKAEEIAKALPDSWIPGQFTNPSNALAHYRTTGPEIWNDTDGSVDIFVAGIGTGGTITGTGRYLKERNPEIRVIGVEPAGSPVLSGGRPGRHDLQGIGAGFIPEVLDMSIPDEMITVTDEEAYRMGRLLCRREGILTGITSGAAVAAAVCAAKRPEHRGKTVVALLPDTGSRYLSTAMFE